MKIKRRLKQLTDTPPGKITKEMQARIDEGRLNYRKDIGWHDPRGYSPEKARRVKMAERYR